MFLYVGALMHVVTVNLVLLRCFKGPQTVVLHHGAGAVFKN